MAPLVTRALSLRQPWAWAVVWSTKRIENRIWDYLVSGVVPRPARDVRIAIHASSSKPLDGEVDSVCDAAELDELPPEAFRPGAVVGTALIRGVVRAFNVNEDGSPIRTSDIELVRYLYGDHAQRQIDRWWIGPYAFLLDQVERLPEPVVCSGNRGFWTLTDRVQKAIAAQEGVACPLAA